MTVTWNTPYKFEQKEYTELNLDGLESLTIKDAIDAQKSFGTEAATMIVPETTTAFARAIAAKATGKPIEFFQLAPRAVNRKILNAVREYVSGAEKTTENHVMRFEEPYVFEGQSYTEVDLSGIANLTSMDESQAENRIAQEGFLITETTFNYLYSCCIASMASKHPVEFFTGLPLKELMKLKNAVNDPIFFE